MSDAKTKYWVGVGYPESMKDDWKESIGDTLELPYAYCVHDKDKNGHDGDRKTHVHLIVVWPNTTTYKNALSVFNRLSAEGKTAFNKIEPIANIRHKYDYLIHDTEDSRKKKKYLYDESERIEGNNFDIGNYEQTSLEDKKSMRRELSLKIFEMGFTNYIDFYMLVISDFGTEYEDIVTTYSGHFDRLIRGNYHKWEQARERELEEARQRALEKARNRD